MPMGISTRVDGVRGERDASVEEGLDVKSNSGTAGPKCEWRVGARRDMIAS